MQRKTDKLSTEIIVSLQGMAVQEILDTVEIADLVTGLDWHRYTEEEGYAEEVVNILLNGEK